MRSRNCLHLSSHVVFNRVRVTRSLFFCRLILSFFFWSLFCLSFFDLRFLVTPLYLQTFLYQFQIYELELTIILLTTAQLYLLSTTEYCKLYRSKLNNKMSWHDFCGIFSLWKCNLNITSLFVSLQTNKKLSKKDFQIIFIFSVCIAIDMIMHE